MNLFEVSQDIARRLTRIFLRDPSGRRPVYGGTEKFQTDLHWMDLILFYEYFHGDNGAGLGASHQTGWTGLVAGLIRLFGRLDPGKVLEAGKRAPLRDLKKSRWVKGKLARKPWARDRRFAETHPGGRAHRSRESRSGLGHCRGRGPRIPPL